MTVIEQPTKVSSTSPGKRRKACSLSFSMVQCDLWGRCPSSQRHKEAKKVQVPFWWREKESLSTLCESKICTSVTACPRLIKRRQSFVNHPFLEWVLDCAPLSLTLFNKVSDIATAERLEMGLDLAPIRRETQTYPASEENLEVATMSMNMSQLDFSMVIGVDIP
ncbi:hypothetical protein BDV40DRAFT_295697 [Aspergillus tamarii]|uniref:Uncharacterized protein n=1 Tax=Aspergillus tamarii TaxID=41984 RepID=A0A5N6V878_ASPTM|nr:hypothetical protein BDV40DRAFT_295697 [Aspergillus tamarii]